MYVSASDRYTDSSTDGHALVSVDCLLPFLPDVLVIPSRLITTLVLAAFIAPLYSARSLGSRGVLYASWLSIAAYAAWFSCTAYMHAKGMLVPLAENATLGELWQGIREFLTVCPVCGQC